MTSMSAETDANDLRAAHAAATPATISFNRLELGRILNLYGRMVAAGEWREIGRAHV